MNNSTCLLDVTDTISLPFSLCISIFMPLSEHYVQILMWVLIEESRYRLMRERKINVDV